MRRMKWLGTVEMREVVTITMQDMYNPRPSTPPRCVYQLVDKRVWDTSGSSYSRPTLGLRCAPGVAL
jgi:hypothetical protein